MPDLGAVSSEIDGVSARERVKRTIKPRQASSTLHPLCSVSGSQGESLASGEELQENRGKMMTERREVMIAPSEKLYDERLRVSLSKLLSDRYQYTTLREPSEDNDLFSECFRETCRQQERLNKSPHFPDHEGVQSLQSSVCRH